MKLTLIVCVIFTLLVLAARSVGGLAPRKLMAFESQRTGNAEIFLWDAGRVLNISRHPLDDVDPVWSHDGRLAFASYRGGSIDVYVFDLETGTLTNISRHPTASDMQPAWSQDGRLAFISSRSGNFDVFVADLDNGRLTNVTTNLSRNEENPVWSADGRLAFVSSGLGASEVSIVDPVTGVLTQLARHPRANDMQPAWSNDGRLAYLSYRGTLYMQVYVDETPIDVDLHAQASAPAWSSDGRLAFAAFDERGDTDVYLVDGGEPVNISQHPAWDGRPKWTPDHQLAFLSNRTGNIDIFLYDPASGTLTNLTRHAANESDFAWQP